MTSSRRDKWPPRDFWQRPPGSSSLVTIASAPKRFVSPLCNDCCRFSFISVTWTFSKSSDRKELVLGDRFSIAREIRESEEENIWRSWKVNWNKLKWIEVNWIVWESLLKYNCVDRCGSSARLSRNVLFHAMYKTSVRFAEERNNRSVANEIIENAGRSRNPRALSFRRAWKVRH